jgi:uncharacterized membrane protein
MTSYWHWVISRLTQRLWFWAGLFALVGATAALAAIWLAPLIPDRISAELGANSVEDILRILATSMLAVATFSLATMVNAFSASASSTTPRASQLILEDRTSQRAIAIFIGTFLFSLVGIIALQAGLYGSSGRLHLSGLGRLEHVLDRVEKAADDVLEAERSLEHHANKSAPLPFAIKVNRAGYVQYIDLDSLDRLAREADGHVRIDRRSGAFVGPGDVLASASWKLEGAVHDDALEAFVIGSTRSVKQDPRYALILLSEVATRALSPGTNDPGTAIDVLARLVAMLCAHEASFDGADAPQDDGSRVSVPLIEMKDVFDDVFTPISREGAGAVEVALRLQRSFEMLSRIPRFREPALSHLALAVQRAMVAMTAEADRDAVRRAAAFRDTRNAAATSLSGLRL